MRSFRFVSLFVALVAFPACAAAADRNGAQVEVAGQFGVPSGSYASADGAPLSDYFSSGPGFAVTGTLGLTRRFHLGVRYGVIRGSKDATASFADLAPEGSGLPGTGPFDVRRRLTTSEFGGLLQYRRTFKAGSQWYLEAGGGVLTFVEHVRVQQGGGELLDISGYQQDPMWTAGAGLSFRLRKNVDLTCGGRWLQAVSSDGDIWTSGDDPGFFEASLGLRYPNY
ncbi:MAG: hypothetical protein U0704_16825 [Candidatus Eisenbacteria bacterium]